MIENRTTEVITKSSSAQVHTALRGVRAVLFDVGGTLLHPDWARLARLASDETGRKPTAEELTRAMKEILRAVDVCLRDGGPPPADTHRRGWVFRRMYGALGFDEEVCERLSVSVDVEHAERHLWCGLDEDAPRVLAALREMGFSLAVISNTEDGRLDELLELAGIKSHFDLLIDSFVVKQRKPDAAIFQLALSRLELEPEQTVYVGDSYGHDALAALAVGMRAVLVDPLGLFPDAVCPRIRSLKELIGDAGANMPSHSS
ncbi:MAG: HAD family hydrolase [Acidobacteria bacterium]|nr:HAD family hydrolase [Acidobacteriota bacterium]